MVKGAQPGPAGRKVAPEELSNLASKGVGVLSQGAEP
jgi:hypothetical protein